MRSIRKALAWSGTGATLSMFVVTRRDITPPLDLSSGDCRPLEIHQYNLEDAANVLGGRRIIEYDAKFGKVPCRLQAYLTSCLRRVMARHIDVAWYGFEGSFDYEYLLSPEIASQIYAVADADGIAIAADDNRTSESWKKRIVQARNRLFKLDIHGPLRAKLR